MVLVRERLADNYGVGAAQLSEDLGIGPSGEKVGMAVRAADAQVHGRQSSGQAVITYFIGAQGRDAIDARQRCNRRGKIHGDGGMAVGGVISRGTQIKVRGQFIVHPLGNGLAKAANHNSYGNHHGDGGGKRADENCGAAKRRAQAA